MQPIDPNNPLYSPGDVERMFDLSARTMVQWLRLGWVPTAFQTPTGYWKIPEQGLAKALVKMGFPQDAVERKLKEFKGAGN